jgi:uncharacterized protein
MNTEQKVRDATVADFPAILTLNSESEHFLSPLDRRRLEHLHSEAALHRVVELDGQVVAFLIAFREAATYDSVNYQWFGARYPRFLYVDRVVVSLHHQGQRLGATFYRDLFEIARQSAIETITCEFDISPPNEVSRRFHAAFGFHEVGTQWVADGKKQVSLQAASTAQH